MIYERRHTRITIWVSRSHYAARDTRLRSARTGPTSPGPTTTSMLNSAPVVELNVGLVLGPRSGLIDIEYDGPNGDAALLDLLDGDVPVTAMWRSARGPHRLFQWHEELGRIRKSSVTIGPLEIRLGGNGRAAQSLLPPSITDGWGRRWVVSLEECSPVPLPPAVLRRILDMFGKDGSEEVGDVDSEEVGHSIAVFHNAVSHAVSHNAQPHAVSHNAQPHAVSHLLNRDHTSNPEGHHSTTPNKSLPPAIQRAIVGTLPGSSGFRNQLLLQFARQLKGIPELATREVSQPRAVCPGLAPAGPVYHRDPRIRCYLARLYGRLGQCEVPSRRGAAG